MINEMFKQGTQLQLLFYLDVDSGEHKTFESLAIQEKNLFTR